MNDPRCLLCSFSVPTVNAVGHCDRCVQRLIRLQRQRAARVRRSRAEGKALCRHCETFAGSRPRGLCRTCYYDRSIRDLYPVVSALPQRAHEREPTMAELDALVAEQGRDENLPAWWPRSQRGGYGQPTQPQTEG